MWWEEWEGAIGSLAPSARDFVQGRWKAADGRVSYKTEDKLWPSQEILVETFQISPLGGHWASWHGTSYSRNPLPGNQRSSLPSFLPFSLSGIASNHTLLTYPDVQRQNHPDKQVNTQTPETLVTYTGTSILCSVLQTFAFAYIQALPFLCCFCIF